MSSAKFEPINISQPERENFQKDVGSTQNIYIVDIPLSAEPAAEWEKLFMEDWEAYTREIQIYPKPLYEVGRQKWTPCVTFTLPVAAA